MRPSILDPLFVPVTSLDGIGPKVSVLVDKVIPADISARPARAGDLLFVLPHGVIDRRSRPGIARAPQGAIVTLDVRIDRHQPPPRGNKSVPYRVFAHDETGEIALTFFHSRTEFLEKAMPVGEHMVVSGKMGVVQRPPLHGPSRPHRESRGRGQAAAGGAGLPAHRRSFPESAAPGDRAGARPRAGPAGMAGRRTHAPPELSKIWRSAEAPARPGRPARCRAAGRGLARLAYDELLAGQLSLALTRAKVHKHEGRKLAGNGRILDRLRAALPYQLTRAQEQALAEIDADMAAPDRMLRLLQGDVGSGKTVVALIAMARAAESGAQSALMAPTEILARQHFATIEPLASAAGLDVSILTGREKGRDRAVILNGLETGTIDIVIGTHALFQESVVFKDLGFVVVDEQHRFGVHQRLALAAKGEAADMLVMTATPIPARSC